MSATAPPERSAPRCRARRTSDSRLTTSPAISSSTRSPRRRDSVSVRTSSRARSRAQASASSPSTASCGAAQGRRHPGDAARRSRRRRSVTSARLILAHLLLHERPDDRGRPVAARALDAPRPGRPPGPRPRPPAPAQVEVLVEDRDRRAEELVWRPRRGPGSPRPSMSGARRAARAATPRAAPPLSGRPADELGDDRAPGGARGQDQHRHAEAARPERCGRPPRRSRRAAPPGATPGHTSRAPGSSGASASSSTTADTGRSSEAPAGTRRAPASAGHQGQVRERRSARPGARRSVVDRDRVVTGRSMGRWRAGFKRAARGGAVCLSTGRKIAAAAFGPSSQSARARRRAYNPALPADQTRRALRAMPRLRQKNVTAAQWSSNGSIGTGDLTAPGAVDLRSQRVRPRRAARSACPRTSSASSRPRSTAASRSTPTWPTRSPPR